MYNQPYFIPSYFQATAPSMMRGALGGARLGAQAAATGANASRGLGLFSRIGSGLSAFRGINWGGLITNTSKTLNVVNQAIPLVRQVGPMFNNVKSMMKLASAFKDETDVRPVRNNGNLNINNLSNNNLNTNTSNNRNVNNNISSIDNNLVTNTSSSNIREDGIKSNNYDDYSPTFFVDA